MTNTTFAQLKKNRKSNFDKLNEELAKASGKVEYKNDDDRFWYPAVDKVGNGYAVIRFLPAPNGEDVPFVRVFEHGFKGPAGSWYIEKSLTTLGKQDPVSEYNSKLWNRNEVGDRDEARKQKRKLTFISNIFIVKDTANPENEGQVRLFRYGKKIFDKLYNATNLSEAEVAGGVEPLDPFDLWNGANLKLKIRNVSGYRNYDESIFDASAPLFKDEKKLEELWKQEHLLGEFIDPKNFKSYDELKDKFNRVMGLGEDAHVSDRELPDELPKPARKTSPKKEPEVEPEVEGDDEDLDYFSKLADSDEEELMA